MKIESFPNWNRKTRAYASWLVDVVASVIIIVLLTAWTSDLRAGTPTFLSPSFFEVGFCNSSEVNTQLLCAYFDAMGGIFFLLLMAWMSPKLCLPPATYIFLHGYGHYFIAMKSGDVQEEDSVRPANIAVFAVILAVGPINGAQTILAAGAKNRTLVYSLALLMEFALVFLYTGVIKKPNFGLLYINITILLTAVFPRALVIGYEKESDISLRVDKKWFFADFFSTSGVLVMSVLEPFFCDSFVASVGGHLLFDMALFAAAVSDTLNGSAT